MSYFSPNTRAMTITFALLTALGPLSTDMYLPSLPAIGAEMRSGTAPVQLTLSAFLLGFAIGQMIYGPLSDRLGRRPLLYVGLMLFGVGSIVCALAASIEVLILGRVLQALGASGPIVLGRAMVRDLYEGPRAAQELARMGTIMGLVPALAPALGGVVQTYSGWRMSFWIMLVLSLILVCVVLLKLPETVRHRSAQPLSILAIVRGFGVLLKNRAYRIYVLLAALTYAGLFAFISGSSFVLQGLFGLSEMAFAGAFVIMVVGYIVGTILSQRLMVRLKITGLIQAGVICMALGGAIMVLGLFFITPRGFVASLAMSLPMSLYALGVGLTLPQAQASAMAPFPDRAGAASSCLGLCQMLLAALVGIGVGHSLEGTLGVSAWPLALAILLTGTASLVVFQISKAARASGAD